MNMSYLKIVKNFLMIVNKNPKYFTFKLSCQIYILEIIFLLSYFIFRQYFYHIDKV